MAKKEQLTEDDTLFLEKNLKYNVKLDVTGVKGNWRASFTIGNQTFYVCERETKAVALWYKKMLTYAFNNLKLKE